MAENGLVAGVSLRYYISIKESEEQSINLLTFDFLTQNA